jgi:DNA-binding transcriptional ArsR family regulator
MPATILDSYFLQTSEQLRAIAEPTRWRMLNLLITRPLTGSQLARLLKTSRPRAHYHLKILEKAGLIQFVEAKQRQHMIERYYRAIAVTYRTDNVLAQAGQSAETNGDGRAGAALYDIIHSMLSLVEVDISNPAVQPQLGQSIFNYQGDVRLSPAQLELIRQELRQVVAHLTELERQNQAGPCDTGAVGYRYTLLVTPMAALDLNGAEELEAHA